MPTTTLLQGMLLRTRGWLRALFRRDTVDREMADEMQMHLDQATDRLMARGMSAAAARVEARREFGNVGYLQELGRDARGVRWIEEIAQDLRFGVRALVKTPTFSIVALLSLVLGIGVNTAVFTILKTALRPGTIDEPSTFVYIPGNWSPPAYDYLRAHAPALSAVLARSTEVVLLAPRSSGDEPRRGTVDLVSDNYFAGLRAPMALGRGFGPSDTRVPGREPVVVLNHRFWTAQFNGDSGVIGRTVRLATGASYSVIGVASRDFTGVRRGGPDLWLPFTMRPTLPAVYQMEPGRGGWLANDNGWLQVYGRLAPSRSVDEARAQIDLALRQLAAADTTFAPGISRDPLRVETAEGGGINNAVERLAAAAILAATLIVLLVACFNVTSLMLARAADRRREIALRLCLGASRSRIVRQLITESGIIAVVGTTLALVAGAWTLRVVAASGSLASISNEDPDRLMRMLTPDGWVLGFALLLSVVSVLAFGLAPSIRASRPDLANAVRVDRLTIGRFGRTPLRSWLVITQVALSLVLLVSAGVLLRSVVRALSLDTGFERDRVLAVSTSLRLSGYDSARAADFERVLDERVGALPGIRSAARGNLPLVQRARVALTTQAAGGVGVASHDGYFAGVTARYFATLRVPIVRGRAFTDAEVLSGAGVVVVSEATARTLWGSDDPLGRTVKVVPGGKAARLSPEAFLASAVVVGVARDAQMVDLGRVPPVFAYVPSGNGVLVVLASGAPARAAAGIRDAARLIDRNALVSVTSLDEVITTQTSIPGARLAAGFAGAIGLLTLLLAAIGIFGLVAYSVAQRTRELGIRRALGATGLDVMALVLRQGLRVVAIGALAGVAIGAAGARLLSALLFGMSPLDPIAYVGVVLVIGIVALVACYIPARRATRVDPLAALKTE